MDFIHSEKYLQAGDIVKVALDQQANVLLLDALNYNDYRSGRSFRYHGGLATRSPFTIVVPRTGHWHIVMDLGGRRGSLRYDIQVIQKSI